MYNSFIGNICPFSPVYLVIYSTICLHYYGLMCVLCPLGHSPIDVTCSVALTVLALAVGIFLLAPVSFFQPSISVLVLPYLPVPQTIPDPSPVPALASPVSPRTLGSFDWITAVKNKIGVLGMLIASEMTRLLGQSGEMDVCVLTHMRTCLYFCICLAVGTSSEDESTLGSPTPLQHHGFILALPLLIRDFPL